MLTLLLGTDWTVNRDMVLQMLSGDVAAQKGGRILIVPELISHDTERRLCDVCGDTASRFAEVLTFTRLAKRVSDAAGVGVPDCLDNGGRLVAMASAARQLHSKLKAYAAVETWPEFLNGLLDAVDEFKRCCISPADLQAAGKRTDGSLAQKLEELSLILEAYDSICSRGKRDPRDQMTWLLEQLEDCAFAENHTFYIDGFPDFTRQHTQIIRHLIAQSPRVLVSLICDETDTKEPAFEKAAATAAELIGIAEEVGSDYEILRTDPPERPVMQVLPRLFQGKISTKCNALKVAEAESVYQECHLAAERIIALAQEGCRFRDVAVVCSDMSVYGNTLQMIFDRYHIPVYKSGTEDILSKTVITTVLSAIDAAVGGYEQTDVLRYLKSTLSPLDIAECDSLENYAIIWNISGSRWGIEWLNHPEGLGVEWTQKHREQLADLNSSRERALSPLIRLGNALTGSLSLNDMVDSVYTFLNEVDLSGKLQRLAADLKQAGDLRNCQILGQLWEILLSALEQLSDMLGDTYWDAHTFSKLLRLLLSQYDVGTIPAVLDAVTAGPVSAMRCHQTKHLIFLGANEGSFPAYAGSAGVLSDQERIALRQLGVPLTGGAMEGLQAEFAEIYGVFCSADETVSVISSGGQPSFLFRRLKQMSAGEMWENTLGIATTDRNEAVAFLVRSGGETESVDLGHGEDYRRFVCLRGHALGNINSKTVRDLYGAELKLSASQVDKLADCKLAYFLKYGLRLKERKQATVDPAEFGTYVHAVLEDTGREIMQKGGFHAVSLEDTLQIAASYSKQYIEQRFSQIDSQRINYLFRRNAQELEMVVTELWQELHESEFEPLAFELAFGVGDSMDSIPIIGKNMTAKLRGFVDRVDVWDHDSGTYYRVVDYKTGKKDFDYCDIFNGLGLQMLLYLFALEENGEDLLGGHPVPAGVQYFPARAPVVSVDGRPADVGAETLRDSLWKRKGLLLSEDKVLNAMEPNEETGRLPFVRRKDGSVSGDLADRRQMQLLKGFVFALLGKMVDDISSGDVAPNPYTRGGRHNACAFCPYGPVCHDATVEGRRNYAAMSAQKFWEEVEKEMDSRG